MDLNKGEKKTSSPSRALMLLQMKIEFGAKGMSEKIGLRGEKRRYLYLYLALMAVAFIPLFAVIFRVADAISSGFVSLGQKGIPVVLAVMGSQMLVVLFSLSHLMSSLYYATDLETLQALPLTPWTIMLSKTFGVYVGELLFTAFLMIPMIATLGPKIGTIDFWLLGSLSYLLVPLIPIAVSLLAIVVLMRFTAKSKRRDLFRVVFGLFFFALVMGFQYLNINTSKYGPDFIMQMLSRTNSLVQVVAGYYPVVKWAAWGLTADSVFMRLYGFLLFCVVSVGAIGLSLGISQKFFLGGITREVRTSTRKGFRRGFLPDESVGKVADERENAHGKVVSLSRPHTPVGAVALKEFRLLVRNPTFLLTALLNLTVLPLMIIMGVIAGGADFSSLVTLITASGSSHALILMMVGVYGVFVALNQVASTAMSREGPQFFMSKLIPLSPEEQIRGKMRFALAYSLVQAIVMMLTLGIVGHLSIGTMALLLFLGMVISWPVCAICMLYDLYHPKLDWTEPNQAMKGNFGTMISGLLGVLYILAIGLFTRILLSFNLGAPWIYVIPVVLAAGTGFLLNELLERSAQRRYGEIEI